MLNDTKLARLTTVNTNIAGRKEGDTYYFIFDGHLAVKINCLSLYPKFMAKLYSTGKLLPNGDLYKTTSIIDTLFKPDIRDMKPTEYTGIDVYDEANDDTAINVWRIGELDYVCCKKMYTEALTAPAPCGLRIPGIPIQRKMIYFTDTDGEVYAIISPYSFDVLTYIKVNLPCICGKTGIEDGVKSE